MHKRPIGPIAHGAIDYGFAALNTLAPTLFGLAGPAGAICYGFAASQGLLNALIDHPLAVKKVIPLRVRGEAETLCLPAILGLPWIMGALKQRNARLYFGTFLAIACANYSLTDYNAYEPAARFPAGQRALKTVEAQFV